MSTLELENIKHPDNSGDNIALASNGSITIDRKSTDGTIAEFRKDGTAVGNIGTDSNGDFVIDGSANHSGLRFKDNTIVPKQNGSDADNAIDLGKSDKRWKDLYLSGGVYLGGTGSANKLDDYEEGTWTPVLSDNSSNNFTMGTQQGLYTKVGNVVTVYFNVQFSNTGSGSGLVRLKGFPFTSKSNSGSYYYTGPTINTNGQVTVSLPGNDTSAIFHDASSGAGQVSEFNSAGNDRTNGSITYLAS
ncbi:hypothetical protein OAE42_05515 [Gammaproteobacteria bacterium]|nr:hypothetical protein [Gammaproteobacteria bacterium]